MANTARNAALGLLLGATVAISAAADDGSTLWLRTPVPQKVTLQSEKPASETLHIALSELMRFKQRSWATMTDKHRNDLGDEGFEIRIMDGVVKIIGKTDRGVMYGAYYLLRQQACGTVVTDNFYAKEVPYYKYRMLNHWDNLDGTIERGYAGNSIWKWDELPGTVSPRYAEYARANASIGINATVLNNVNASPKMLETANLEKVKAIADVLRPYGIRVFLSVNFASPMVIGKLKDADPLKPEVAAWWKDKAKEIYNLIPDFGGFLVKANSEGQPGPCDYGRTHADGANVLADALKPYGGVVIWRAFVYGQKPQERVQQALLEFQPLEGKFRDNVIVQAKNGPLDFQPCEPFHPMFGKIRNIPLAIELQITQEYLGQSNHLAYLATLWKEVLDSDTYQNGPGSTVAKKIHESGMIAGVANIGDDVNWTRHPFAQANWYAFGRLAWNPELKADAIAKEWLAQTFTSNPAFVEPVCDMMMSSVPAIRQYMMPLGLAHIFASTLGNHYGPGPWLYQTGNESFLKYASLLSTNENVPGRKVFDATETELGADRTKKGTGTVMQYNSPLCDQYNDLKTCPERYWLWFHRLGWKQKMPTGDTFWEHLCGQFESGAKTAATYPGIWESVKIYVDPERYDLVLGRLKLQAREAVWWKDACILFYQSVNHLDLPKGITPPIYDLAKLKRISFPSNVHFCPKPEDVNKALDGALKK